MTALKTVGAIGVLCGVLYVGGDAWASDSGGTWNVKSADKTEGNLTDPTLAVASADDMQTNGLATSTDEHHSDTARCTSLSGFGSSFLSSCVVTPASSEETMVWWWHTNSGRAIYVPAAFYYDALAVFACESRWNTYAVGRAGERGWAQIHPIHAWRFHRRGWGWDSAFDLGRNTEIALEIWSEAGGSWRAWSCKP